MRFIAPVPLLEDVKELMPWTTIDLTPYVPVTANLALIEFTATLTGRDETALTMTAPARLVARAQGDVHRLREYVVVGLAPASTTDGVTVSGQALVPIGQSLRTDFTVKGNSFDGGLNVNLIAFFEECPILSSEA